jgi:Glycolipid transfer protein (GLTP)
MTQGSRARNLWRVLNALRFLRQLLMLLEPEDACLRHAATHAYTETMAQTHLWAIRQMVYLALWASPTRDQFLTALAAHDAGAPVEQIMKAARRYVVASELVIRRLDALYPGPCVDETGA